MERRQGLERSSGASSFEESGCILYLKNTCPFQFCLCFEVRRQFFMSDSYPHQIPTDCCCCCCCCAASKTSVVLCCFWEVWGVQFAIPPSLSKSSWSLCAKNRKKYMWGVRGGGGGEREKILAAIKGDKLGTHGTGLKWGLNEPIRRCKVRIFACLHVYSVTTVYEPRKNAEVVEPLYRRRHKWDTDHIIRSPFWPDDTF